jgi:hypothetical protein
LNALTTKATSIARHFANYARASKKHLALFAQLAILSNLTAGDTAIAVLAMIAVRTRRALTARLFIATLTRVTP